MKKSKVYKGVRFAPHTILRADELFSTKTQDPEHDAYYNLDLEFDDCSMTYDSRTEFLSEYQRAISYHFAHHVARADSSLSIAPSLHGTRVSVALATAADVEEVLQVFDWCEEKDKLALAREPSVEQIGQPLAKQSPKWQSYRSVFRLPSCDVDKVLIQRLQEFVRRACQDLESKDDRSNHPIEITIEDKHGTQTVTDVSHLDSPVLPGHTRQVCLAGGFATSLSISFTFSRDRSSTRAVIDYRGPNARAVVLDLRRSVKEHLSDHQNLAVHFFKPDVLVSLFIGLIGLYGFLFSIGLDIEDVRIALSTRLFALSALVYAAVGLAMPYSIFDNQRSRTLTRALRWFPATVLTFLVGWGVERLLRVLF